MRTRLVNLFVGLTVSVAALAQPQTQESFTMNLQQCIDYGIQNQASYLNAKLDLASAKAKVGEVTAIGLPQINLTGQLIDNINIQQQFLPQTFFNPAGDPTVYVPVKFGAQYTSNLTLAATQLIFDGSFFVGLGASKTLVELNSKGVEASELQLIENITKAYYLVLVNKEREKLFDNNIARIQSTLDQLSISLKNGFVEDIDVKRLQVTLNNLLIEKQKFQNIQKISIATLKFQMGMPQENTLNLEGSMNDLKIDTALTRTSGEFDYNKRIEYTQLGVNKKLQEADKKNNTAGYLPRLVAFGNYGYNIGTNKFDKSNIWKDFLYVGLNLNIPIFDGLSKSYKIQQSQLNILKADNSIKNMKVVIDFQREQSRLQLTNDLRQLESQKKNLELAEEVVRVTRIKYLQGIGSNIEVINAESTLKETQINYFSTFYDVVISKVNLDKANGNLKQQ